jgi:hypothetical protein
LQAAELPRFVVPGKEKEMQLLEALFEKHHSPRTTCTLWDAWIPMSTLWPAVGESVSADAMRQFIRHSLSARYIDEAGYVTMNQHRGLAHPGGWPFPTWTQAGGAGWHFTHHGDPYARMLKTPLATLKGIELSGVEKAEIDEKKGLLIRTGGGQGSLTTPPFQVSTFVAPFVIVEWTSHQPQQAGAPWLEWTTISQPEFSSERRIAFPPPKPAFGQQFREALHFSTIPTYREPKWNGTLTRLRLGWDHPEPARIDIRAIYTAVDSRHPITSMLYVHGCVEYFDWTRDVHFLRQNIERIRRALAYAIREFEIEKHGCVLVPWVGHDGRTGFEIDEAGKKHLHHGRGVGNNYWDLLPFGHKDCLATLYLFESLGRAAHLEETIAKNPDWNVPPPDLKPDRLRHLAKLLQTTGGELFWNPDTGRFVACIDADGKTHDYGFTFLNLEAVYYGFATNEQARSILAWVDGRRVVDGDTSQGKDIYHWRFAPRATTRRNTEWYAWVWHAPDKIPWGGQVQDGGAVLGFSYQDLMARIQVLGPDNAWKRLQEILSWFEEVQAEGGYRTYYSKPGRGTLQGGGTAGGLGIDREFMETVLLPQTVLYGFLGLRPDADGFFLQPKLPSDWPSLTVTRIHIHDHVLDIKVEKQTVTVIPRVRGQNPLNIRVPHGYKLNHVAGMASLSASAQETSSVKSYPDGRPVAKYRLDAEDAGRILKHGSGPNHCDALSGDFSGELAGFAQRIRKALGVWSVPDYDVLVKRSCRGVKARRAPHGTGPTGVGTGSRTPSRRAAPAPGRVPPCVALRCRSGEISYSPHRIAMVCGGSEHGGPGGGGLCERCQGNDAATPAHGGPGLRADPQQRPAGGGHRDREGQGPPAVPRAASNGSGVSCVRAGPVGTTEPSPRDQEICPGARRGGARCYYNGHQRARASSSR